MHNQPLASAQPCGQTGVLSTSGVLHNTPVENQPSFSTQYPALIRTVYRSRFFEKLSVTGWVMHDMHRLSSYYKNIKKGI